MNKESIDTIVDRFNKLANTNFRFVSDNRYRDNVELINKSFVELELFIPNEFPIKLPEFYINKTKSFVAHIGPDGKICLFDKSSLIVDTSNPDIFIKDCYDQAVSILNIPLDSDEFKSELVREFNSYWYQVSGDFVYWNHSLPLSNLLYDKLYRFNNVAVITDSLSEAKIFASKYTRFSNIDKNVSEDCVIITLRDGSKLPRIKKKYNLSEIRRYISSRITSSTSKAFDDFLKKKIRNKTLNIIIRCKAEKDYIIFGFRFIFKNKFLQSIKKSIPIEIKPLYINRIDYEYLLFRSESEQNVFRDKHILLLGCGSVGGYLADNLCQLGLQSLDILDNDVYNPENSYRHYLGFDKDTLFKRHKADLLKERLEMKYPYIEVDSLNYMDRSAEFFISDTSRLKHYDLIVSALGEPTINLEINRILNSEKINIPFVCCFNEPYGIGGHTIVTNIDKTSCLRCLYTDVISSDISEFRGSFVEENQNFKRNISGCASAFVPYSSLDSKETAIQTTRIIVEIFNNAVKDNCIVSWLGNDEKVKTEGYTTSNRFKENKGKSIIKYSKYSNENCPICQKKERRN